MKLVPIQRILATCILGFAHIVSADDIDIFDSGHQLGSYPLRVMFAVDLRQQGLKEICSDASSGYCRNLLGEQLYDALDLVSISKESDNSYAIVNRGDGRPDTAQTVPDKPHQTLASSAWRDTPVDNFQVLRAAIRVVLKNLVARSNELAPERQIEVGLMAMRAEGCVRAVPPSLRGSTAATSIGCTRGAHILKGFTNINLPSDLNDWLIALAALPYPRHPAPWVLEPGPGHTYRIRDIYLELHRYLNGYPVFGGSLDGLGDGSESAGGLHVSEQSRVNNDSLQADSGVSLTPILPGPDPEILQSTSLDFSDGPAVDAYYRKPSGASESCAGVRMVHILSGSSDSSQSTTDKAIALPPSAFGLGLQLPSGDAGDLALVEFLADPKRLAPLPSPVEGPAIKSYFLKIEPGEYAEQLAKVGGTQRALPLSNPNNMLSTFETVLSLPSGESHSMVAAAEIINGSDSAQNVRDLFFPIFGRHTAGRWAGNIKKLKISRLGEGLGSTQIIAQAPLTEPPTPALSDEDGQILPDALTFWTDPMGFDVLTPDASLDEVIGTDGRSVTRGGAGQQIRGFLSDRPGSNNSEVGARQLFTLNPGGANELLPLDANLATLTALAPLFSSLQGHDQQDLLNLIHWIRGQDAFDGDGDGETQDSRDWLLGDLLHSRPLVINYGARPGSGYGKMNPDVRLFFGSNDGFFRIVRNTWPDGEESGEESWAFLPPEFLSMQQQLALKRIEPRHAYGMDGEPVAVLNDTDGDGTIDPKDGDSVWVFIGQRRGGQRLFAFDMTNPDSPRLMWALSNTTPGFEQLGLTFSTPRVANLDLGRGKPESVLVFGGGYHGGWDGARRIGKDGGSNTDFIGNAVYVVTPETGELVWYASGPGREDVTLSPGGRETVDALQHSIPSPISIIDSDNNGVDDRAYVGDSGGNVWRIDFNSIAASGESSAADVAANWKVSKVAALGGSGISDRRFFHAPDVTLAKDDAGDFVGIVILSGNRAAPLDMTPTNYAYLIKDRWVSGSVDIQAITHAQLDDVTPLCSDQNDIECQAPGLVNGWKMQLASLGEKGLSTPVIADGKLFFTTYVPARKDLSIPCEPDVGRGRLYVISLEDASPAQVATGRLQIATQENAVRYRDLGQGMPGDIAPFDSGLLVPGANSEIASVFPLQSAPIRRSYWREYGVDEL